MSKTTNFLKTNKNAILDILKKNDIFDLTLAEAVCAIIFSGESAHITIDALEKKLTTNTDSEFNRKQIFDIIDILIKFGFIKKNIFDTDGEIRYEPLHHDKHHDHFICSCCQKIIEFYNEDFEKMQRKIADTIGLTLSHKLELYGLCNDCLGVKKKVMPLTYAENGKEVILVRIDAGKNFVNRLAQLGFIHGVKINIISNTGCGSIIVEIKGSRIALGFGESNKIIVSYFK